MPDQGVMQPTKDGNSKPFVNMNTVRSALHSNPDVSEYQKTSTLQASQCRSKSSSNHQGKGKKDAKVWEATSPDQTGDNYDVKKLIKMQFEQAQMLMDLQKQFGQVQEIEKVHQLDSIEQQSLSRNYNEGTILSSKHSGRMIDGAQRQALPTDP